MPFFTANQERLFSTGELSKGEFLNNIIVKPFHTIKSGLKRCFFHIFLTT